MRIAADCDVIIQIERCLAGTEEPEVEPTSPRRLILTVEEVAETLCIPRGFA